MTKILNLTYSSEHDSIILETSAANSLDDISASGEGLPPSSLEASKKTHFIYLRPEAIADRMALYGLDSEKSALEAIVKEHIFRYCKMTPKSKKNLAHVQGGMNDRIKSVSWHPSVDLAPIEAHKKRIAHAHKHFWAQYNGG